MKCAGRNKSAEHTSLAVLASNPASGKNGGWTGVQEKVAASGLPYAGATTIASGRIALVRVLD